MQGQQRSLLIILILLMLLIAMASQATPFTPKDPTHIVASWDKSATEQSNNLNLQQRLEKAAWHLEQGQYAGQANQHFGRARALLSPLFEPDNIKQLELANDLTHSHALYLWARVLQHQHQFALAQQTLQRAIAFDPHNLAAILLKANVLLAQGHFAQSKQTCSQLLGKAELVITAVCVLEVTANQDKLADSYAQIRQLLSNKNKLKQHQQQDWLAQLAAEMALRLDKAAEAAEWLNLVIDSEQSLAQKPLSFIALWADVQLSLKQPGTVLQQLSRIITQSGFKDDALLVRLSLAEQFTTDTHWQSLLALRVELRLARQDTYHSADLARYYLDIQPNAKLALRWAQINWQQTKLYDDKQLLNRALMMQNSATSPSDT